MCSNHVSFLQLLWRLQCCYSTLPGSQLPWPDNVRKYLGNAHFQKNGKNNFFWYIYKPLNPLKHREAFRYSIFFFSFLILLLEFLSQPPASANFLDFLLVFFNRLPNTGAHYNLRRKFCDRCQEQELKENEKTCGIAQNRKIAGSRSVDKKVKQSSICDKALVTISFRHCTALTEFSSYFKSWGTVKKQWIRYSKKTSVSSMMYSR